MMINDDNNDDDNDKYLPISVCSVVVIATN